jgi:hypothetical protein
MSNLQELVERACSCGKDTMHTIQEKDGWDIVQCIECGAIVVEAQIPDFPDEEDCEEEDDLSDISPIDEEMK